MEPIRAKMTNIVTVGDLIGSLEEYDLELPVLATWEGICVSIEVYRGDDGTVLIDADQKG